MTFTIGRTFIAVIAGLALLVAAMPNVADAAASGWKIYSYNSSGQAFSSKQAPSGTGTAEFDFQPVPDDALLAMNAKSSILGKTITATFAIVGAGTFTYYGAATSACSTPASVRLYFSTANGPFAYTNYWWSNPEAEVLTTAPGTATVTATVEPSQWSDWNGQFGAIDGATTAAFNAAASNPDLIGLSFGGGCFFQNGVGMSSGSATFKLVSFTFTP